MDDDSAEEDEAELSGGGARGSPQRRAFSAPGPGESRVCAEASGLLLLLVDWILLLAALQARNG